MGFASHWLDERALFPEFIKEAPDENTGIIVVIPARNEPGILFLLDSLASCDEPDCRTEVIVVINSSAGDGQECLNTNRKSLIDIEQWKKLHPRGFFRVHAFDVMNTRFHKWGVGYARKTGMDEAVRRFNLIDRPDGVIVNLDADCLVATNYFTAISMEMNSPARSACSIYFEHPLSGNAFPANNYLFISWYELHLRYFVQGMKYAGHPFAFYTVGSAVAVRARAYIRAGGMNRRQAGEDFYFIQKLIPAGGYFSLNSTVVYPSPRISLRVPFGTGATIAKLSEENSGQFPTYNQRAFEDLHEFFGRIERYFTMKPEKSEEEYNALPESLRLCLDKDEFIKKILELKSNTSGIASFRKRFFTWFNMFRIVKFMNAVHREIYSKVPVTVAAADLLKRLGVDAGSLKGTSGIVDHLREFPSREGQRRVDSRLKTATDLLEVYRKMERLE
jgi:hypothetical protein